MGVIVPMVQIGEMGVAMRQTLVPVTMGVRLAGRVAGHVRMLMMFVVDMGVIVGQRHMQVSVLVPFHEVEVDTGGHKHRGGDQQPADGLAKH